MFPENNEYPGYYEPFIGLSKARQIGEELQHSGEQIFEFILAIPDEKGNHRYADGKWSIKELLIHIIDTERVYAYRALRFARHDATQLPGFDENLFAAQSNAEKRTLASIASEFKTVRTATLSLLESLDESTLKMHGIANGNPLSVRAIFHIIAGHGLHHINILKERYL
jgi:uncharacterized damage-inducible protein DinB